MARALEIQLREDPRKWRELVDAIENRAERAIAEEYLRSILERMRTIRRLRGEWSR